MLHRFTTIITGALLLLASAGGSAAWMAVSMSVQEATAIVQEQTGGAKIISVKKVSTKEGPFYVFRVDKNGEILTIKIPAN